MDTQLDLSPEEAKELRDLTSELRAQEEFMVRNPLHRATRQYMRSVPRIKHRIKVLRGEAEGPYAGGAAEPRFDLDGRAAQALAPEGEEGTPRDLVEPGDDGVVLGGTELADGDDED